MWNNSGSVPEIPDFDDGFVVEELANLDISIVNATGNALILPDAVGRMPFSNSSNNTVEHIYFAILESGSYSVRVQNLSNHATTYGWALWVPEPSILVVTVMGMLLQVAAGRSGARLCSSFSFSHIRAGE